MSEAALYFKNSWEWFRKKSQTRAAETWLGIYSFFEALVLPIPTDIFLALMILANRAKAIRLTVLSTLASVFGATVLYTMTVFFFNTFIHELVQNFGFSSQVAQASDLLQQYAFATVFIGAFTPIPYTPVILAAGILHANFFVVLAASLVGRGLRYSIVAFLTYIFGEKILPHIQKYIGLVTMSVVALVVLIALVANASNFHF